MTKQFMSRGQFKVGIPPATASEQGGNNRRGFMDDLSSEAQSARAKRNKGRTPWRAGPICCTKKAHERFKTHNHHQTQKGAVAARNIPG